VTTDKDDAKTTELAESEHRTLAAFLDAIIPPTTDGRLPGAGAPGIIDGIEPLVCADPELRALVSDGPSSLDAAARSLASCSFVELAAEQRAEVVSAVATELFQRVVLLVCKAYYQDPRVLDALGFEPRPPFPQGFAVAPTDPALLEPVRRRAPMYRKC